MLVRLFVGRGDAIFHAFIYSLPILYSLRGMLFILMITAVFTYGIGLLIIGAICFGVAYFSTKDIKDKPIKIASIILIVFQILILLYAIILKTGAANTLT